MGVKGMQILEEFRKLPWSEKREVAHIILQESLQSPGKQSPSRQLDDVLGKFSPLSGSVGNDHNDWFADAVLFSKR